MAQMHELDQKLESELPSTIAAPRIQTPNLVVLLGSTAALSGLELMRHLLSLQHGDQRRVGLVYIDTDDPPAPLVEFRRRYNNFFQEFPLRIAVPAGITNATPIINSDQHTFIKEKRPQYFANGAGGIRNNGHVAACFHYQYIYDVLDRALAAITRLSTDQHSSKVREVQANIVAFLGGGTGSGILVDLAVMVRDLLMRRQYKQRLNLFCMLPEPISGVTLNDLHWRKSNATACLLEVLAYGRAAAADPTQGYEKHMRENTHHLTNDPIANEVYLIDHASMDSANDTARIVGFDIFQRTTDASGVGFLEHSKWVDRRTLGATDDRGLPTIFGTSCPLEVRFPAADMATTLAQIATADLLPLLASYRPRLVQADEQTQQLWRRKWQRVARLDANANDPQALQQTLFRRSDFEDAALKQVDLLWTRLIRQEQTLKARIEEIIKQVREEEFQRIRRATRLDASGAGQSSLIDQSIQQLQRLQQEYSLVLGELKERAQPRVPGRPQELEEKLVNQPRLPGPLRQLSRDYASAVAEEYNERLKGQVRAMRYHLLEQLFQELCHHVQEALTQSVLWFSSTDAEQRARELRERGLASMAWQGRLEYPHPHQRHLFDLQTLRTQNGHNISTWRLYRWVTGGDRALVDERATIDLSVFVNPCIEYLGRHTPSNGGTTLSIDRQAGSRLADHVVDFFHDYFMEKFFSNTNLFELLDKVTPPPRSGQLRSEQISDYLLAHLQHMSKQMSSLVDFEAELWPGGLVTLDTSVYLGIHWRNGNQEGMLDQALINLGSFVRGQSAIKQFSLDPHRLQISYAEHAISLSTVRDFYLEQNSAMEYYFKYQKEWDKSNGTGPMPVHSSGEAQRLVSEQNALGYNDKLVELVIRRPAGSVPASGVNPGRPSTPPLPSNPPPGSSGAPSQPTQPPPPPGSQGYDNYGIL